MIFRIIRLPLVLLFNLVDSRISSTRTLLNESLFLKEQWTCFGLRPASLSCLLVLLLGVTSVPAPLALLFALAPATSLSFLFLTRLLIFVNSLTRFSSEDIFFLASFSAGFVLFSLLKCKRTSSLPLGVVGSSFMLSCLVFLCLATLFRISSLLFSNSGLEKTNGGPIIFLYSSYFFY